MRTVLITLACAIAGAVTLFVLAYLFTAFVLFNDDASTWSSNWRGFVAFCSAVGGVVGTGLYVSLSRAFR